MVTSMDGWTETDRQTDIEKETGRLSDREINKQINRQTEKEWKIGTDWQRDKQTDR